MTTLQLGLIAAGVVFVAAVALYNWFTLRRAKKHIDGAFAPAKDALLEPESARQGGRVEPTLRGDDADGEPPVAADRGDLPPEPAARPARRRRTTGSSRRSRSSVAGCRPTSTPAEASAAAPSARPSGAPPGASGSARGTNAPDPDIESIVMLQPVTPVGAGALAAGLHARIGKPLRWFGRHGPEAAVAAAPVGHAGGIRRGRRLPAARRPQRRRQPAAARQLRQACRRHRADAAGGVRRPRHRRRRRARRGARPHLRRPRRADRPDPAEEPAHHHRRHAAARRGRGGRVSG